MIRLDVAMVLDVALAYRRGTEQAGCEGLVAKTKAEVLEKQVAHELGPVLGEEASELGVIGAELVAV